MARAKRQQGAAALEFALLFVLFFGVMYAIIGYSVMFLLQQGLTQAAAEAARAAVRIDPLKFASTKEYQSAVALLAKEAATNALSWLPAVARSKIIDSNSIAMSWTPGTKSIVTGGTTPLMITTMTLTVTVTYPNYGRDPLIPAITLPGFKRDGGDMKVPVLPDDLVGASSIQLQS